MNTATLEALAAFPQKLEAFFGEIPGDRRAWSPPDWAGIPSERFSPIEQICHVRDIEIDGYQGRLRRALTETKPHLPSIDGYALARERDYAHADPAAVLAAFRTARARTLAMLAGLTAADFARPTTFEDYGALTLRGLVHLLCSHDQQHLAGLQWLLARIAVDETTKS